jgi:REP element-mobilizing transposase RayT
MWNDTDFPLAVFFTFRCYGTWLHGDERGSVDRYNNIYGAPRIPENNDWKNYNKEELKQKPVTLNAAQRGSVDTAIREICHKRKWELFAINVRTNHVHSVINIGTKDSEQALNALKANATRQMRQDLLWLFDHTPWAKKGSRRNLWNEHSVVEASDYVINGQGDELPDFDWW